MDLFPFFVKSFKPKDINENLTEIENNAINTSTLNNIYLLHVFKLSILHYTQISHLRNYT